MAPLLNNDILLVVLRYCDRSTLRILMTVSRSLHEEATRSLLSDPLVLRDSHGGNSEAVMRFLSVDNGSRLSYIRDLDIQASSLSAKFNDLHLCFQSMTNLRRLFLQHAEALLSFHPELVDDFVAHEGIEELVAFDAGQVTCKMLRNMRSRLRRVRLTGMPSRPDATNPDPVEVLSQMRSSLEELHCTAHWNHTHSRTPYTIFPKLRKFSIEGITSPSTPRYADAFPALTHLSIVSNEAFLASDQPDFPCDQDLRSNHIRLQPTWPDLQEIVGDAGDVYNLGLRHHVPCLRMTVSWMMRMNCLLSPVLSDMRPVHLSLIMASTDSETSAFLTSREEHAYSLASLLGTHPAAAGIKCLELHANTSSYRSTEYCIAPLMKLLENVLATLRRLPLETLVIHWTSYIFREAMPSYHDEARNCFVHGLLEQVPSLNAAELHWHFRDDYWSQDEPVRVARAVRSSTSIESTAAVWGELRHWEAYKAMMEPSWAGIPWS
ncbi:hypothetical protein K466DRAFT_664856 [Polyporus arcularius HHB13444]|uniref:F-box domain-containing protein n=1 Tax=Polyporus arcularius HHB13444 TaxID=1314778 RepID=A0A5C3P6M4_9APHY|nr:hypothetical protein K466DRAFT_664856 [Polyporus arcularius HHB13444]